MSLFMEPISVPEGPLTPPPGGFLLESSEAGAGTGRWSFLGGPPRARVAWRGGRLIADGLDLPAGAVAPLSALRQSLEEHWSVARLTERDSSRVGHIPFIGGAVGYFAYELGGAFERVPAAAKDTLGLPDFHFGLHGGVVALNRDSGEAFAIGVDTPHASARAEARAAADEARVADTSETVTGRVLEMPDRSAHERAVERAREYIAAGDIYQVNLTAQLVGETQATPGVLWSQMLELAPAPFTAAIDFDDYAVISASPERFLRLRGREVETRPIKGTRRRSSEPREDARLRTELLSSAKDRAELLMIVDLHRNDLGRVCDYGTVQVPTLFGVRTFAAVHHLEATITGRLAPNYDRWDLIRAAFPAGSITGAPKIRAMEIIGELEPVRRGAYCGALGYLDIRGDMDLSVAIRTAVVKEGRVHYGAGGGIVADSQPAAEYEELIVKARPFFGMLGDPG